MSTFCTFVTEHGLTRIDQSLRASCRWLVINGSQASLERLGRAYSRPVLDLFLFAQKTVDLGLHCPDAFLLPFRHRLSVFDKALDQQVLKLHDPSSLLWG